MTTKVIPMTHQKSKESFEPTAKKIPTITKILTPSTTPCKCQPSCFKRNCTGCVLVLIKAVTNGARRIYRLILLLLLSSLLFAVPYAMMKLDVDTWNRQPKVATFLVSQVPSFSIDLYDASVVIQEATNHTTHIKMEAMSVVLGASTGCSMQLGGIGSNVSVTIRNCHAVLTWPPLLLDKPLPALKFRFLHPTEKNNIINNIHKSSLIGENFGLSSLVVHADAADISLDNIYIQDNFQAYVRSGDVSLTNVNTTNTAKIDAHTNSGSVMVMFSQSRQSQTQQHQQIFNLSFSQAENAHCIGAPSIQNMKVTCDKAEKRVANEHFFTNSSTSPCSGVATLGANINPTTNTMTRINVSSKVGAIYVILQDLNNMNTTTKTSSTTPATNYSDTYQFQAGEGMPADGKLLLGDRTRRHLQSIAKDQVARPTSSLFVTFDLQNSLGSTIDRTKLLYASRQEMLMLEPWAFKLMSLGLVSPRSYDIPLRWQIPIACPFSTAAIAGVPRSSDYLDLNRMALHLREQILSSTTKISNDTDQSFGVVAHKSSLTSHMPVPNLGLAKTTCVEHTVSLFNGKPLFSIRDNYDSLEIIVVVTISFIIGLVVAIASVKVATTQLRRFVLSFLIEHTQRYAMRRLKKVVTSAAYNDPRFKDQFARQLEKNKASEDNEDEISKPQNNSKEDPNDDNGMIGEDSDKEDDDDSGEDEDDDDAGYDLFSDEVVTYPFSLPEHLSQTYDRRHTKSLRLFLQRRTKTLSHPVGKLAQALGSGPRAELVTLKKFQSLYHSYCFRNRFQCEPLDRCAIVLEEYGVSIKCVFDHRTDAFLGIRFTTEKERRERIDVKPFPRESALSFFVRKLCVLSPFETDYVTFRIFARKYELFTNHTVSANTRSVPVTKRAMENLGVSWRRLTLRFIEAHPFQHFSSDVAMSQVMLKANVNLDAKTAVVVDDNGLLPIWFLRDTLVVFIHVMIVTILVMPFLVLPLVAEAQATKSSTVPAAAISDIHYHITIDDLFEWGRPMYIKLLHIRMWSVFAVAIGFGVTCYFVFILELILYYSFEPFEVNKQAKSQLMLGRRILHTVVYICLFVCFGSWVGYTIVVLTWIILGAVLEPEYYLPYATAAGSIILFACTKGSSLLKQFQTTKRTITRAISFHFAEIVHKRMLLLKNDDGSDSKSSSSSVAETKALRLVDSDSTLQEILARCNVIDLMMALGLAKGSASDVEHASEAFGMNKDVLAAVIAAARRDHQSTLKALHKIGINGTIGATGEVLHIFFRLSEKQNESSLRLALKEAILCSGNGNAHEIESVIAIGRGAVGRLVDVFKEMDLQKSGQNKELHALSALLELVRNDGMAFQKQVFTTDWSGLAQVCGLPRETAHGIGQLYMQQVRSDAATSLLANLQCNTTLAQLVMAVSAKSADNLRLYGPGSLLFEKVINELGIEIPTRDLAAFVAVSMSSLLNVSTLGEINGLHDDIADSVSHLMGDSNGMGDISIGLEPKEFAGHLAWVAAGFNISAPIFLGLICIASKHVEKSMDSEDIGICSTSESYVEEAVAWFVGKNPTDMDAAELKDLVYNLCIMWSSDNSNASWLSAQTLLNMENPKFKRYSPIILLSRGFLEPVAFFEKYGSIFGLKSRHLKALQAQEWHFTNSAGGSEAFTSHTWKDLDYFRVDTMKRITKFITEKLVTMKNMNRSKLRVVRGLLLMEIQFPKILESTMETLGLSNEMARNLASFAMMSCEHLATPPERTRILSTLARLLDVSPAAISSGILNICHDRQGECWSSKSVEERMKTSAGLRRGISLIQMVTSFELDDQQLIEKLQEFVSDFDLISTQCRFTRQAVGWLSDQLQQPRFLMYCISRDFEPGFGASAAGPIDEGFAREIHNFLNEMNVTNVQMLDGIDGICLQEPKKLAAFAPFLGVTDSENIVMACQLFGSVDLSTMVLNLEKFVNVIIKKAGKHYKEKKSQGQKNFMKVEVKCHQPNPGSVPYQVWNFTVAVLAVFYSVVVPCELIGVFYRTGGVWDVFNIVSDILFLLDIFVSLITPFYDARQKRFILNNWSIASNYIQGWLIPDCIASIPVSLIGIAVPKNNRPVWFPYVRILKLLRLIRTFRSYKKLKRNRTVLRNKKNQNEFKNMDLVRAFAKLAGESNEPLENSGVLPSDVLASLAEGLPKSMLAGLLDVHHGRQAEVKQRIITMTSDGSISMDESLARGLTSLATGEVDGIEDVAEALGFDPDVAEGLAFVASSVTINVKHSQLSASSSLHKLTDKLGVETQTVAALLAIVNQDYNAGTEINAALTLVDINGLYLTAIMAMFCDDNLASPQSKTDVVISTISPLKRLYAPSVNDDIVASLLRLVQGDVTVVRGLLGDRLGYSRQERDTLCALVLVSQRKFSKRNSFEQQKFMDFSPSESWDWDATRDCGVSSRMIARVLGIDRKQVFVIIAACHGHSKSLLTVAELMGFGTDTKKVKVRLQTIAGWKEESSDDNEDDSDNDDIGDDAESVSSTASSANSTASSVMSIGTRNDLSGVSSTADSIRLSQNATAELARFVSGLNEKFLRKKEKRGSMINPPESGSEKNGGGSKKTKKKKKLPIKEETVLFLISLAHGDIKCKDWTQLQDFVRRMRQRERDNKGNPAVTFSQVQQLLAVAVGETDVWAVNSNWWLVESQQYENWGSSEQDLEGFETNSQNIDTSLPKRNKKSKLGRHLSMDPEFLVNDKDDGEGILGPFGFDLDSSVAIQFIVMLGKADPRVWFLENEDGVVSSKIYPDTRIVVSIAALAANDIPTIDRTLAVLSALLATDVDAVRSILCLALGDTTRLSHEISKITRRAGGNVTLPFAMGFCAGASLKIKEVKDMLGPLCNQLNVNNDVAASIVLSTQCVGTVSRESWQTLCTTALELQDEDGIVTDEERLLPRFWLVDCIAAFLAQDPVQIAKYSTGLDSLLGYGGLWTAVYKSGVVGANGKPPENLSTFSRVLYGIAKNEMSTLPHLLRVMGIANEEALTNVTILISVFNRQFSSAELNALEQTFQSQDPDNKVPRGALTAIAAALIGDMDQFAYGISQVTRSGGSSGHDGSVFKYRDGFAELLVSMARSDEHGDVSVFQAAIHTVSHQAMSGSTVQSRSALHQKAAIAARTARLTSGWKTSGAPRETKEDGFDINGKFGGVFTKTKPPPGKVFKGYDEGGMNIIWTDLIDTEIIKSTAALVRVKTGVFVPVQTSSWTTGMKHVKTLGVKKETKLFQFIYAVLTMDSKLMLETVDVFGFDPHLAVALAKLVESTVEIPSKYNDDPFGELIKRLNVQDTPVPVFGNLLNIISSGYGALGEGRIGVSVPMFELAANYLDVTKLEVLDAVFLAQIDAPSHTERIVACVPAMLKLMDLYTSNLEQLVTGLIYLTSPMDSKEAEINALKIVTQKLSLSYKTKPDVVAFCVGLARSNMKMVQQIGRQVGEFDLNVMSDIFKLVMRLTPICRSIDNNTENSNSDDNDGNENDNNSSESSDHSGLGSSNGGATELLQLQPQQIFSQCVPGGDSYMSFEEFKLACKILNLNSHDHRLLELFLLGDQTGTGLLTSEDFSKLLQKTTNSLTTKVQFQIGETDLQYMSRFTGVLAILIALFTFVLVGVSTFSMSGGFAAATSGSLFAIIAGFMNQSSGSGNGSDGEDDSGNGDVDVSDAQEVAQILKDILSMHMVD